MPTKTEPVTLQYASTCVNSPTGAHHWVIDTPKRHMTGTCKYCHTERAFRPFEEEVGFNNSVKKERREPADLAKAD